MRPVKIKTHGVPITTLLKTLFKRVGYELFLMKCLLKIIFNK